MSAAYGSMELMFDFVPDNTLTVEVRTDVLAVGGLKPEILIPGLVYLRLGSETISDITYIWVNTVIDGVVVDTSNYELGDEVELFEVRIVFYDSFVSVYCNNLWVYTYGFSVIEYTLPMTVSIYASGAGVTLLNVRKSEIPDGREAVYVDYEQTSENAIQSIIQQRPVEIYGETGRTLAFTYNSYRDDVDGHHITRISESLSDPSDMASDGIVYYSDVGVQVNEDVAASVGLITKMYRLSELSTGAMDAARIFQQKAFERRNKLTVVHRLDPRIEIGDRVRINKVLSGTNTIYNKYMIVEDIQVALQDGNSSMTLRGREVVVGS